MGGSPWEKYKTPEIVSEGGPWAKYGQMSAREAVDALPGFLTRTADEKSEDRRNADNRAFVSNLPQTDSAIGKAGAFSGQYLNSSTFGQIDNLNAAVDSAFGIGPDQSFSDRKRQHRDNRQDLREANPVSALVGDIGGYLAPGTAAWKGLSTLGKSIPGAATLSNTIAQTGRVPAWLQRIAGSVGLFTADAAVFGGTVGASNEEAAQGRDLTPSERGQTSVDYAKANLGEMADGVGIDVPSWARGIPVSAVFPLAGSVTERTIKGATTGGRSITPDRVQAEMINSIGRAPAQSASREMAEVIDAGPVNSGTIKTFRFIENALRDAGKSTGLSKDAVRNRIAAGFKSIQEALPTSADGRTPLAVLIEREFADDLGPVVAQNLRKFLLKVGLDDPGVTRGFIDDLRQTQVDDFRGLVDENLGSQSAIDFEKTVAQGINKKAQSRQQVIDKAKEVANDGPIAQSLREQLLDNDFKGLLEGARSERAWKDVDTFIDQDPWNAANILQQELGRLESSAFSSGNVAQYTKLKETKEWIQDILGRSDKSGLPGYNRLTGQIAAESRVRENLGYTDGFGKEHAGFGRDLKKAARSERGTQRMVERYQGETPRDKAAVARLPNEKAVRDRALNRTQAAARISTGEVLSDQLRGARPGGVNAQGQDVVGLRLSDLQTVGMMDALRNVFADAGDNIADGVNSLVNRRQFLADIDPRTGSNTANKQNALATGDAAMTGGLGRTINANALADVMMLTSGLPPIVSMLRNAPDILKAPFAPSRAQKAEIANALLNMPQPRGSSVPTPAEIQALTGHSNPRWRNDERWKDPVLTGGIGGNQRGAIDVGGGPRRRKDLMRDLRAGETTQFPAEQSQIPQVRPEQPINALAERRGVMDSPLAPLAGIGIAGTGAMAAHRHFNRPQAATEAPQEIEEQPFGPSLKPDLGGSQQALIERANEEAWSANKAQRQEYWQLLKSRGDGSSTEWNRIHEERAAELEVTPEDKARGVISKRLPYIYDGSVGALRDAPIEELINGQWIVSESVR